MRFCKRTPEASKDIISDLPDPILGHILSFLSTKDAFRTSILSQRWKYTFTQTPNLHFVDCQKHQKLSDSCKKSFIYFGYKMLLARPTSRLDRLCLRLGVMHDSELINTWVSYAVRHGVRELDLEFSEGVSGVLSPNLFSCATLVVLRLDSVPGINVPDTVCFPSLEVLHLMSIRFFDNNKVKKLLCASNKLRELKVDGCKFGRDAFLDISIPTLRRLELRMCHDLKVSIEAPRLGCFTYTGSVRVGYSCTNTESLVKADIDIWHTPRGVPLDNFYGAFSTVKYLGLSSSSMKGLYRADRLRLGRPQLETPKLKTFFPAPKDVPICLSLSIREIKIMQFDGSEVEFLLLEYFMKNARALEKLTIKPILTEQGMGPTSLNEKLRGLQKSSRFCTISLT